MHWCLSLCSGNALIFMSTWWWCIDVYSPHINSVWLTWLKAPTKLTLVFIIGVWWRVDVYFYIMVMLLVISIVIVGIYPVMEDVSADLLHMPKCWSAIYIIWASVKSSRSCTNLKENGAQSTLLQNQHTREII